MYWVIHTHTHTHHPWWQWIPDRRAWKREGMITFRHAHIKFYRVEVLKVWCQHWSEEIEERTNAGYQRNSESRGITGICMYHWLRCDSNFFFFIVHTDLSYWMFNIQSIAKIVCFIEKHNSSKHITTSHWLQWHNITVCSKGTGIRWSWINRWDINWKGKNTWQIGNSIKTISFDLLLDYQSPLWVWVQSQRGHYFLHPQYPILGST